LFSHGSQEKSTKNENKIKAYSNQIKSSEEDSKFILVEKIEELGFIPSLDKGNDTNAA